MPAWTHVSIHRPTPLANAMHVTRPLIDASLHSPARQWACSPRPHTDWSTRQPAGLDRPTQSPSPLHSTVRFARPLNAVLGYSPTNPLVHPPGMSLHTLTYTHRHGPTSTAHQSSSLRSPTRPTRFTYTITRPVRLHSTVPLIACPPNNPPALVCHSVHAAHLQSALSHHTHRYMHVACLTHCCTLTSTSPPIHHTPILVILEEKRRWGIIR